MGNRSNLPLTYCQNDLSLLGQVENHVDTVCKPGLSETGDERRDETEGFPAYRMCPAPIEWSMENVSAAW